MKMNKRIFSAVTAMAMAVSISPFALSLGTVDAEDLTAIQLVEDMGLGWNLGNTFDCNRVSSWASDIETGWGNPKTTESMITSIKSAGFDSIRIPITWAEKTDSTTFDIDDAYLARIKEVVDYAYTNDMYVIINTHWDFAGSNPTNWLNAGLGAKTQFTAMWTEIANYFKDYSNKLVFEGMNEVTFDYSVLKEMNQAFVDTVRATGGNNANRLLLIAGKNTDLTSTCSSQFIMPTDSANMLAVSIHYYAPPTWAVATPDSTWGYDSTWGTASDIQAVYNDFNTMKTTFVDKGIPVIIGEYGVLTEEKNGKNQDDVATYLETVASAGLGVEGISTFLWDTSGHGDMSFFNRENLSFFNSKIKDVYSTLSSGDIKVPDGLIYTDRVTYDTANLEELEDGYNVDIKPYKDVAKIKSVIVEGSVSSASDSAAYSAGGAIAFNAFQNGGTARTYTTENWFLAKGDTASVVELDGNITNDDGEVTATYELDYDYLNVCKWWDWSEVKGDTITVDIDKVTLIFEEKIYIDESTGVTVPTEPTTEEPTTEEPTTEEPTTEEPTTEEPTTEEPTTEPIDVVIWGDANDDGIITVADVVAAAAVAADPDTFALSAKATISADVHNHGDGISATDASIIQEVALGTAMTLPVS